MNRFAGFVSWKLAVFLLIASTAQAQGREGVPTLSGYMEIHLNKTQNLPSEADLHRFVLMVGHSFSDRIKFWSEVEVEHAFVEGEEESGEVAIEQAYIDLSMHRRFNLRAGMVLTPVGILNERHEPPTFHGVERTFVDSVIIPTTWHDVGVGAFGDLGRGFSYKAYLMPGLDATGFTAEEGLAEGRQQGSHADASDPALTGRLEFRSHGLTTGGSFWYGGAGFGLVRLNIETPTVGIASIDARYRRGRHELRGQYSVVSIDGAGELNRAIQARIGIGPNVASRLLGAYGEAATRISPDSWTHELMVFGRYEVFDTQNRMPAGFLPLDHLRRSAITTGVTYYPDPDVAFKMDFVQERNKSSVVHAPWHVNFGVGWWF